MIFCPRLSLLRIDSAEQSAKSTQGCLNISTLPAIVGLIEAYPAAFKKYVVANAAVSTIVFMKAEPAQLASVLKSLEEAESLSGHKSAFSSYSSGPVRKANLLYRLGRSKDAAASLSEQIKVSPLNPYLLVARARYHAIAKDDAAARDDIVAVKSMASEWPEIRDSIAVALRGLGDSPVSVIDEHIVAARFAKNGAKYWRSAAYFAQRPPRDNQANICKRLEVAEGVSGACRSQDDWYCGDAAWAKEELALTVPHGNACK